MSAEIVQMMIASTAHVTNQERATLDENGYSRGEYGWLIYVGEAGDAVVPEIDAPSAGLDAVIVAARAAGCMYLMLDRDGDALDGVPVYQW